jgi:uncharacterized protein (TIGR02231 family)
MKKIILLLVLASSQLYANDIELDTKIKNVIVYQQGAQINRTARYTVKKGITELIISNISSVINPSTLQIKANGDIVILDTKHHVKYPEPLQTNNQNSTIPKEILREIALLKDSLFELSYQKMELQNKIDVLNSQKRIIENNGTIKGTGKVNDSIPLLQDAINFYHDRMNKINFSLLGLLKSQSVLFNAEQRMNTRLNDLNNYSRNNQQPPAANQGPIHQIIITVSAELTVSGTLDVSYLVNNAGWTPLYDLRSSNDAKTIELTYKAQVYQNTGIDWDRVSLNLSTNNPYDNKTKPTLQPWYVDNYAPRPANREGNIQDKSYTNDLNTISTDEVESLSATYSYSSPATLSAPSLNASHFTTTIQQMVAVEYAIDLPYSIKSNNERNMVLIKRADLDTKYLYYTVPKVDPSVYLIAQITNLDELNLVPGKATIFHDGSFLGSTVLNPSTMSDTLDLSLGKASNITVKRTLLKNEIKEKIVGDKIEKTFAYQISVKNQNRNSIELIIEDQVPRARNNDIEIELVETSKGKLNSVTGLLKWQEKLKPSELKEYELIYTVKYDKSIPVNLANH